MTLSGICAMLVVQQRNDIPIETGHNATYYSGNMIIAAQHSCQRLILRLLVVFLNTCKKTYNPFFIILLLSNEW